MPVITINTDLLQVATPRNKIKILFHFRKPVFMYTADRRCFYHTTTYRPEPTVTLTVVCQCQVWTICLGLCQRCAYGDSDTRD